MPAVSIAQYVLPTNLRTTNISGSNVSSTGTVTFSTDVDISSASGLKTFEAVRFNTEAILEMIKAADQYWNNYLIGAYDFDVEVREVIPDNGVGALTTIVQANTHGKVVACYGRLGSSSLIYVGTYGVWGPLEFGIQQGKNVAMSRLKPIGAGLYIGTSAPTAF